MQTDHLLFPVLPSRFDQIASVLVMVMMRGLEDFRDDVGSTVQSGNVDGGSLDTVDRDGSFDCA